MLMNCILALAILGALGICFGWGGFTSLAFLWQLPLLFAALWLGLVLLAFLFLILWCLPISMGRPGGGGGRQGAVGAGDGHPRQ